MYTCKQPNGKYLYSSGLLNTVNDLCLKRTLFTEPEKCKPERFYFNDEVGCSAPKLYKSIIVKLC